MSTHFKYLCVSTIVSLSLPRPSSIMFRFSVAFTLAAGVAGIANNKAFLSLDSDMQPEVVALILSEVPDEWKSQAAEVSWMV